MSSIRTLLTASAAVMLGACGGGSVREVSGPACSAVRAPVVATIPDTSPYDSLFTAAAVEFGVPASVLRSIGFVETRWQMVQGQEEFAGRPAAHGVMALRGDRLREGARRAGLEEQVVRADAASNIRAAAALLRADADALGISGTDPERWAPVVSRFSGIELPEGQESYVREVYAASQGQLVPARSSAPSRSVPECPPATPAAPAAPAAPVPAPTTDAAGAFWRASPNFNTRQAGMGGVIHKVIIHSCEGAYTGCWSWLANPASEVSAHYVVREDGAEITQLVREASRAWHIGATYNASLNAGHEPGLTGVQSNHFTIGVEHAGYASQTKWPDAQIDASARLVCEVSRRWQIPRDRLHIVSHGQLQPANRTDPGANWPWTDYVARINSYCAA